MTHDSIWQAIERLARTKGLTCSALARKCGLDATTFNKSKRWTSDGKPRWPSTCTLAKVISVTGITNVDFARLIID